MRGFLLACLKNYRSKTYRESTALKRGGKEPAISLDREFAERQLTGLKATGLEPDQSFDRAWAQNLIRRAMKTVESSYGERGKLEHFRALEPLLGWNENGGGETYADIAARLGVNEQRVKTGVHRLRRRVREEVRAEVSQTVDEAAGVTVEQELKNLLSILS